MARRLFKRDRSGRFARTSGGAAKPKKALSAKKTKKAAQKSRRKAAKVNALGASRRTATNKQKEARDKRRAAQGALVGLGVYIAANAAYAGYNAAGPDKMDAKFNNAQSSFVRGSKIARRTAVRKGAVGAAAVYKKTGVRLGHKTNGAARRPSSSFSAAAAAAPFRGEKINGAYNLTNAKFPRY